MCLTSIGFTEGLKTISNTFLVMLPILFQIQKIVRDVDAGSAHTKGQESQHRLHYHRPVHALVGSERRYEDQQVLNPLIYTERSDHCLQPAPGGWEHPGYIGRPAS